MSRKSKDVYGEYFDDIYQSNQKLIDKLNKQLKKDIDNTSSKFTVLRNKIRHDALQVKSDTPPYIKHIDEVVKIDDIEKFTDATHDVSIKLVSSSYYTQTVTTKIIGMEHVEWWEYILLYGFIKGLKISYEYSKIKSKIDQNIETIRSVDGHVLEIILIPKGTNKPQQFKEIVNGQRVIREKGTIYGSSIVRIEIPQIKIKKTQEYTKGYFMYEDTFDALEIDYDTFGLTFTELLTKNKIHESLINEIIKKVNNGRLSGV